MTSHGDLKTMNRNAIPTPTSFLSVQEDFHQEVGHSLDLDQKRSGILLMVDKEKWDIVAELMMIEVGESGHPVFRASSPLSPRNAQKQRRWENYQYTSAPMETRLKLFFAQLFLLINSLSTAQSQICVMNTESAKQER